jgi:ammonium transporter, Amt family
MALDPEVEAAINALWVLVAGIFCFFLQAGFGLLEVGSGRSKNAQNIMLKNLVDISICAIAYWTFGYAFAYGEGGNTFIGNSYYFLKGTDNYVGWFFQFVFAGTTATIVSGAVAERCRFRAYLLYSLALSGFIYPVASHWIWHGDGFLNGKVLDFAGSGAVHLVGGAAAMAGSIFVGPRIGKFTKNPTTGKTETNVIVGHDTILAALGCFILWMGFFAFNGASCSAFFCPDASSTGRIVVVTTLAAAAGGLALLAYGNFFFKIYDLKLAMNGVLAGMVSSCR